MEAFIFSRNVYKILLLCCSSPQAYIKLRTISLKNQCCVKEERLEIITLSNYLPMLACAIKYQGGKFPQIFLLFIICLQLARMFGFYNNLYNFLP
jgi:hypothetical protein